MNPDMAKSFVHSPTGPIFKQWFDLNVFILVFQLHNNFVFIRKINIKPNAPNLTRY